MVMLGIVCGVLTFLLLVISLQASTQSDEDEPTLQQRRLQIPYPYFVSLGDNTGLETTDCTLSWTEYFDSSGDTFTTEAKIVAGACVKMEPDTPTELFLHGGLSVEGKLVIPDGRFVRIETPRVVVQGILEITSTKAPNGVPDVEILLTAATPPMDTYTPLDDIYGVCDGACTIGEKAFAVLGGQLKLSGLPPDFPAWVPLVATVGDSYQEEAPFPETSTGIVVDGSVNGKWSVDGEVLITSHTYEYTDQQVRKIDSITVLGSGHVELILNETIVSPITQAHSMDFAVEVAYLSRNIRLDTTIETIQTGGHLIVMNTPDVPQKIEGVEIFHFGRQGELGRYPIHLHFCHEVPYSIVSKNVIRQSNQRCIVAHATHYLKIEENIAYDTSGHCFLTEDGLEYGNEFRRNLGALTKRVEIIIPMSEEANNGIESDNTTVSTFWITNPNNTIDGNVAAGSEQTGFWLDLSAQIRGTLYGEYPDLNPEMTPLAYFENNIAHSNGAIGYRTYPGNYLPVEEAVFRNLKSFRNRVRGWYSHVDYNLVLEGCLFADNGIQVDFDRADNMTLRSSTIIGISQVMRDVLQSQVLPFERCGFGDAGDYVVGVQHHAFNAFSTTVGNVVSEVDFTGFTGTDCRTAVLIQVDHGVRLGSFESFHTLSGNSMETGATPMSLCRSTNGGYVDVFIPDVDSTLNPTGVSAAGTTSMFISNSDLMAIFVTDFALNCVNYTSDCYAYCRDTCFGSVTFDINPADTRHIDVEICEDIAGGSCTLIEQNPQGSQDLENAHALQRRVIRANLPTGKNYTARFLDDAGVETWPEIVETTYEVTPACGGGLAFGAITVIRPDTLPGECDELIPNGEVDGDSHGSDPTTHWIYRSGGADPAVGMGVDGGDSLVTEGQVAQFLDERCFETHVGRSYEITAMVKLSTNRDTGEAYECNPAIEDCPQIGVIAYGDTFTYLVEPAATMVMRPVAPQDNGYQKVEGVVDVTTQMSDAYGFLFYVERNRDGFSMFVDKVSMKLLPSVDTTCGTDLVLNGDFSSGNTRYWRAYFFTYGVYSAEPGRGGSGDTALMSSGHFAQTSIDPVCLIPGQRYEVVAKYKLFAKANPGVQVSITTPDVQLIGSRTEIVARTTGEKTWDGWDQLYGHFVADTSKISSESLRLVFRKGSTYYNVIDDVSITPIQNSCDQLMVNGDMELGVRVFWVHNGGKVGQGPGYSGGIAALSYDRTSSGQGMRYRGSSMGFVDYTCFSQSESFIVSAKVKLLIGGEGETCTSNCPTVTLRIMERVAGSSTTHSTYVSDGIASGVWDANEFQHFEYEYFPMASLEYFELQWRDFPALYDLLVDDMSIVPSAKPSSTPSVSMVPSSLPSGTPSVSIVPSSLPSGFPSFSMMPSDSPVEPMFWSILPNPAPPVKDRNGEYIILKNRSPSSDVHFDSEPKYKICRVRDGVRRCTNNLTGTLPMDGIYVICRDDRYYANCDFKIPLSLRNQDTDSKPSDTLELIMGDTIIETLNYDDARSSNTGKCWEKDPNAESGWSFQGCTTSMPLAP